MLHTKVVGTKIAEARKKINLSQAQLAELLFISPQAVGKWERGESMPDIITFNRLAEILGVDLNYFSDSFPSATKEVKPLAPNDELDASNPTQLSSEKQDRKLGWDMSFGNWVDADFSGLKNLNEKFSSSNMQRCKFIGSDLSGLMLRSNNVDSCDFSGSNMSNSKIQNSHFVKNIYRDCSMKAAQFSGSYIKDCDFTGADFTGAIFKSGGFEHNTIANAVWKHTSFIGMALDNVIFNGTLEDCYFENCGFNWVKFENSTLINIFFKNNKISRFKRIRFVDCQADRITYEFLKIGKADLAGITLMTP